MKPGIGIVLVGLLVTSFGAGLAAAEPTELVAALKTFRSDPPRGWSYTQTTEAEGRSTVERYDAAKPEFDRWTLEKKDGRPPSAEETQRYLESRSRRSRGGTAPKLAEQLDAARGELVARDDQRSTYRCPLLPAEAGDNTADHLRATLVVHRATGAIERIELRNAAPFRPAFGVSITEMRTLLTYALPAGDQPAFPLQVETQVRGTAFWFKSLDAGMTIRFSDYVRATRPPAAGRNE